MARKPADQLTRAIESITELVHFEIELIDRDARIQNDMPENKFAAKEKENFLLSLVLHMGEISSPRWRRLEEAFPEEFPSSPSNTSKTAGSGVGEESLDGEGSPAKKEIQCPPKFINVDGVCIRIGERAAGTLP